MSFAASPPKVKRGDSGDVNNLAAARKPLVSSSHDEDARVVMGATKQIQQFTSEIKKAANNLNSESVIDSRKRVDDAAQKARTTRDEAKRILDNASVVKRSTVKSSSEQKMQQLMHQKQDEALLAAYRALEDALKNYDKKYEDAMARKAKSDAAASAVAKSTTMELHTMDSSTSVRPTADVEIGGMQLQEIDLTDTIETHAAIVDEYANDIAHLAHNVMGLQQAMKDLSLHTDAQGEILDNIESNMSNTSSTTQQAVVQIVETSRLQRRGTKRIWTVLCIAVIVVALIIIVSALSNR